MDIDEVIRRDILETNSDNKARLEEELKDIIIAGDEYRGLSRHAGWRRLEKEIAERANSLSARLLTTDKEKDLFKIQGEFLGLQSILNIVETAIENADQARKELEGDKDE